MNNMEGMTLEQVNHVLNEMRSIYEFNASKTYFGNLHDNLTLTQRRVEIITTDENTGVTIVMSKGIE